MVLFDVVDTCTVVGTFVNADGTVPAGVVEFVPSPSRLAVAAAPGTILTNTITANVDTAGAISVVLPATDDDDLNPVEWTYEVRVRVDDNHYSFHMAAPGGTTLDLAEVTPIADADGTAMVVGPQGPAGDDGADGAAGPGFAAGGDTGQLLAKASDDDYDTMWIDVEVLGMSDETIDTDEIYRVILFSDGTTRAIPFAATNPDIPTDLTPTVRVNSVKLTWTAGAQATSYIVYRDGVAYATTTNIYYRDSSVVLSSTYDYSVQSVSAYALRSAITAEVEAFIDPALNIAPTCEIRAWPVTVALGNRAVVRVNSSDADAQVLATLLEVDVGTLIATADPTVWVLEPA